MVADLTQHRSDIDVDIKQFNVDAATVLTIISLHDGQSQLTISTSTIREQRRTTRGVISAAYRTAVNTVDEQFTYAMEATIDTDIIPQDVLERLSATLHQWMGVSAANRRELAFA